MKNFFKFLVLFILFFTGFSYLSAEEKVEQPHEKFQYEKKMPPIEPGKLHEKHIEKLSEKLNLTEEQKEKISKIMKEGWQKIEEERKKMMERTLAIRKETDKKIEKLLTPEQLEKFRQFKKEFRPKEMKFKKHEGFKGHGEKRPPFPPEPEE